MKRTMYWIGLVLVCAWLLVLLTACGEARSGSYDTEEGWTKVNDDLDRVCDGDTAIYHYDGNDEGLAAVPSSPACTP